MTLQDIWYVGTIFYIIVCTARFANYYHDKQEGRNELDRLLDV